MSRLCNSYIWWSRTRPACVHLSLSCPLADIHLMFPVSISLIHLIGSSPWHSEMKCRHVTTLTNAITNQHKSADQLCTQLLHISTTTTHT